jgi:hypothetical protein
MTTLKKPSNQSSKQLVKPLFLLLTFFLLFFLCLSLRPFASAETYEVIEDGQVYIVETGDIYAQPQDKKSADFWDVKIGNQMQKLNERLNKLANKAMEKDLLTDKQQKHIKNELKRSNRANERLKKDKAFKEIGKNKNKNKKNQSNLLDQEFYALEDTGGNYDTNELEDFSDMIEDMNSLMDDANDGLELLGDMKAKQLEVMHLIATGQDYADPYKQLKKMNDQWYGYVGYGVYKTLKLVSIGAEGIYEVCTCYTRQCAVGWNTSTGGIIASVARSVCDVLAEVALIALDVDNFLVEEAKINCILQIGKEHTILMSDINDINGVVGNISGDVGVLVEDLAAALEEIDNLQAQVEDLNDLLVHRFDSLDAYLINKFQQMETILNTPHGQRPGFSNK